MSDELEKRLVDLGFSRADVGPENIGFARISACLPEVCGVCSPIEKHQTFLASCSWNEGPLIAFAPSSGTLIYWEQFFLLSTEDFPTPLNELRDYIDYGLDRDLAQITDDDISIGPGWRYLYPCRRPGQSLADLHLGTSQPILGNGIRMTGGDVDMLLHVGSKAKAAISDLVPIPHIWAFPDALIVGSTDNFYDVERHQWYMAEIDGLEGRISLSDIAPDADGVFRGYLYNKEEKPEPLEMSVNDLVVRITDADGASAEKRIKDLILTSDKSSKGQAR